MRKSEDLQELAVGHSDFLLRAAALWECHRVNSTAKRHYSEINSMLHYSTSHLTTVNLLLCLLVVI